MAGGGASRCREDGRGAGVGPSLPAGSRAFPRKVGEPAPRPGTLAVPPGPNGVKAPPSTRHANTRAVAGVRLSLPPNENVALVPVTGPSGPPVITVSGGVLSTMTVRAAEAVFWPWSVAAAVRGWTPSGLPLVSQLALAVMAGARGAGAGGGARARLAP